jgi:hypothetical protein
MFENLTFLWHYALNSTKSPDMTRKRFLSSKNDVLACKTHTFMLFPNFVDISLKNISEESQRRKPKGKTTISEKHQSRMI